MPLIDTPLHSSKFGSFVEKVKRDGTGLTMVCPRLFFSGEVLDVDGITGGFNFQHCWTSGWIAGMAVSKLNQSIIN